MTFVNPFQSAPAPVVPNLPTSANALQNKYQPGVIQALQSRYSPQLVNALLDFEVNRAARGIQPLSAQKTLKVLSAAQDKKPATQAKKRDPFNIFGNIASDVGEIVTSIPKMPATFIQEARQLGQLPQALSAAGGNPAKVLQAPIIRLLPGAYTASNILSGDINEIVSHPVMTTLDVLPYWQKTGMTARLKKTPIPGDAGTLGELGSRAATSLGDTTLGQLAQQAWAPQTRRLSSLFARKATEAVRGKIPGLEHLYPDELSGIRRQGELATARLSKAAGSKERFAELDEAAFNAAESGTLDQLLDSLSDAERAAVADLFDVSTQYRNLLLDRGDLAQRTVGGVEETYSLPQAARIDRVQASRAAHGVMVDIRKSILDPTTANLFDLYTRVTEQLNLPTTLRTKRNIYNGYIHALDAAGFETPRLSPLKQSNITEAMADLEPSSLTPRTGDTLTRRKNSAQTWLADNRAYTEKSLNRFSKAVERAESNIVPARWQPLVEVGKKDRVEAAVRARLAPDDPALPEALQLANERLYGVMKARGLLDDTELATWEKEAIQAVNEMRAAGVNPTFVHHVTRGQAKTMEAPTLSSVVPKPSQIKSRINDWTPSVPSLTVSVGHQGLELAREAASRAGVAATRDMFTVKAIDAIEEITPQARRVAARRGTSVGEEVERLLSKRYVKWSETENGFVAGSAKAPKFSDLRDLGADELLIPRYLSDSLMRISAPAPISRVFDPVTNVFRYSVLPFSPRFQVNNIGGGAILSALEEPRVFRQIQKGFDFARSNYKLSRALAKGDEFASLPEWVQEIQKEMPASLRAQFGSLEYSALPESAGRSAQQAQTLFKVQSGAQQAKMFAQSFLSRGKSIADASYRWNQLFDDMYRAAAYFEGTDQAIRKGMSKAEAVRAGEELVNKIQPRWLEMTPFERSLIRPFVPFYAFLSHVFRYAYRYPVDHPWRASVMAGFARAEMEDYSAGLPQLLGSAFFISGMNEKGERQALDFGGMNPFRNLGDDLTLAGFASELNPAMKLALQQLGYDPRAQGPALYPDLEFDPQTGGMRVRQQNALSQLADVVTGFVPPASVPLSLLGTSSDFNELMVSNPGAAKRMLLSNVGIPLIYKNVPVAQTYFKGELARQTAQEDALNEALRTGNWSTALQYPELGPYAAQLRTLQEEGKLAAYQPGQAQAIAQQLTRI